MATIKALVKASLGRAEIQSVPYPKLPDDHILVKATAWAINPTDVWHLDNVANRSSTSSNMGSDYAGVVVEVGPAVTKDFNKGDRIAGWVPGGASLTATEGAFAEFFTAKGDVQIKIPDNISDTDAATQGIAIATLGQSFYRELKLPLPLPDQASRKPFTLFIYGGSTAMGIAGIQFAKLSGGTVITTASPTNFDYLKSLGADYVVDYKSPTLLDDLRALTGGAALKYAFDTHPGETSAAVCAELLSRGSGAKYVSLIFNSEEAVKTLNPAVQATSVLAYSNFGEPFAYGESHVIAAVPEDFELQKEFATVAERLLSEGKLKAPRVFLNRGGKGLEGLLNGLDAFRANGVSGGKLVYTNE